MGSIQVDDVEKKDAILRLCPFRPVDQVVGHLNLSEQKKSSRWQALGNKGECTLLWLRQLIDPWLLRSFEALAAYTEKAHYRP